MRMIALEIPFADKTDWTRTKLITERARFVLLATLHSSMDWLSSEVKHLGTMWAVPIEAGAGAASLAFLSTFAAASFASSLHGSLSLNNSNNNNNTTNNSNSNSSNSNSNETVRSVPFVRERSGTVHKRVSETSLALHTLSSQCRDLADRYLMLLAANLRVLCYYHLDAVRKVDYNIDVEVKEPDPFIISLNRALAQCAEDVEVYLQPATVEYLFASLHRLISQAIIRSRRHVRYATPLGVAKMCRNVFAVQQNLMNLVEGLDPAPLDNSRDYIELILLPVEEFLAFVENHRTAFSRAEYEAILGISTPLRTADEKAFTSLRALVTSDPWL